MAPSQTPTRRQPGPAVRVLRRVIAIIIVVAFSSAAAGGIIVLLVDIGSETTFQVVSTTALTGASSVAAFCGATLLGRRGQWFGAVTIGLAAITLALSLWFPLGRSLRGPFQDLLHPTSSTRCSTRSSSSPPWPRSARSSSSWPRPDRGRCGSRWLSRSVCSRSAPLWPSSRSGWKQPGSTTG
jgi:hypothetical protein